MAISIQFYGSGQVIQALEQSQCHIWAIFQGRQFMFKCELPTLAESKDLLDQILENIAENPIIYTLKLYECPEGETIKIDEKTKCDGGSFNFKVIEADDYMTKERRFIAGGGIPRRGGGAMEARLLALEENQKRILDLLEDPGEDEKLSLEEEIIGLIREPSKLKTFIEAIKDGQALFMGNIKNPSMIGNTLGQTKPGSQAPAAGEKENLSQPEITGEDLLRLQNALDLLGKNDPRIIDHLEKLAKLSEHNKPTFNMAIKMLEGM